MGLAVIISTQLTNTTDASLHDDRSWQHPSTHTSWGHLLALFSQHWSSQFLGRTIEMMLPQPVWELGKRQVNTAAQNTDVTLHDILTIWLKIELWHLTGGPRLVRFATLTLRMWSCHLMPSIWCWYFMRKFSMIPTSSARVVHVCRVRNGGENKRLVYPDLDRQQEVPVSL